MRNLLRSLASFSVVAALGCTEPPPPGAPLEVSAIAGHWRADGVVLDISDSGNVSYVNERGLSGKTELSGGSVSNLSSTGFDVTAFIITSHFVINAVPTTAGTKTTMTIDGVVLEKLSAADSADAADAPPGVPAPAPATLPAAGTLETLVGSWEGAAMRLHIDADGTLNYRRGDPGSSTKMSGARVANITPASFDAGFLGINTTFRIDAPAQIVDGKVVMTVDGVVLTKVVP